jgi:hypothetical protein
MVAFLAAYISSNLSIEPMALNTYLSGFEDVDAKEKRRGAGFYSYTYEL